MDNKYYTPELSEFHIGFEYEFNHKDKGWINFKFGNTDDWSILEIDMEIENNEIRVKYLYLQDLEDLGFVKTNIEVFKNCYKKDSFVITNMEEYESNHVLDLSTYINKMARIFRASIRNKSELIKLLAQFTTRY